MAAFHNHGLLHVEVDDDLLVLGMLADRRDELGRARTQTVNRLHRLPGFCMPLLLITGRRRIPAR
jgi:transposase